MTPCVLLLSSQRDAHNALAQPKQEKALHYSSIGLFFQAVRASCVELSPRFPISMSSIFLLLAYVLALPLPHKGAQEMEEEEEEGQQQQQQQGHVEEEEEERLATPTTLKAAGAEGGGPSAPEAEAEAGAEADAAAAAAPAAAATASTPTAHEDEEAEPAPCDLRVTSGGDDGVDPSTGRRRPLRLRKLVGVDLPVLCSSPLTAVGMLGGMDRVETACKGGYRKLQFRFRPGDELSIPMPSQHKQPTSRLLLRVKVRRDRATGRRRVAGAEVVGSVGASFGFNTLADFQYLTMQSLAPEGAGDVMSKTRVSH